MTFLIIIKIIIISLFAYLGSIGAPWFFGTTGGWYTLGRPLVACMIVGLVLGDLKTALGIGIVLQAMYIGVITPGAVLPFDVNFAGYLVPALIILSKADPSVALVLAVPVAMIGVLLWNLTWVLNVFFVHQADHFANKGDSKGIVRSNLGAQVLNFVFHFVPAFIILAYGSTILKSILAGIPTWLTSYLGIVSGMLPALGIGILLNMIIREKQYMGIFLVGFVVAIYLKLPIIAIALIGGVLALFMYSTAAKNAKGD